MVKYIIKRILLAIVILFGVSVIIYSLVRMMPGDFITNKFMQMVIDGKMSEKEFNRLLEVYGLADRSFWGILKGYFTWIGNVFQGDLGRSFKYEDSVSTIIVENMGISFGIAFAALILEFIIAIPLGVKAATKANEILKKAGKPAALTLSEEARAFQGGLLVCDGDVEVNCTFETLVRLARNEVAGEVTAVLFA